MLLLFFLARATESVKAKERLLAAGEQSVVFLCKKI
jgi:hypothetical protein